MDYNAIDDFIPMTSEESRGMSIISSIISDASKNISILSHKNINDFFNEVKSEAIHDFEMMPEGKGKDLASFFLYLDKIKFINYVSTEMSMSTTSSSDDMEKFLDYASYFGKGLFKSVKRTAFINDVVESCRKNNADQNDKTRMTRIFEYYAFADHIERVYKDDDTYNNLRKKCISAYNAMKSKECQETILKYVSKDFLKVK